jgi:NB-ARC domain/TIR domain/SIR2-like domain
MRTSFTEKALEILGDIGTNSSNLALLEECLRRLVPFVGAGLSVDFGYPTWGQFLQETAVKFGVGTRIASLLANYKYEEAAEELAQRPQAFDDDLRLRFDRRELPRPLSKGAVRHLPRIAHGPVLTTNFDRVLELAFADVGRDIDAFPGVRIREASRAIQLREPVLLKLHGDYSDFASRVLTLSEYSREYGSPEPGRVDFSRPLPSVLAQALGAGPFLFLGCSLNSDRTTRVIAEIAKRLPGIVHFALLPDSENTPNRLRQLDSWNIRPLFFPEEQFGKIEQFLECVAKAIQALPDSKPAVSPAGTRIFISYAWKDGAELASRLLKDLTVRGYEVWLDPVRLKGRASWSQEIEDNLDRSDVVVALQSAGFLESLVCRGEQLRSLRQHKCVIPLLANHDAGQPAYLYSRSYLDFSDNATYSLRLTDLQRVIASRDGATLMSGFKTTHYETVPPLPQNFVPRPAELEALRQTVLSDRDRRHVALVALQGMGGVGKTLLAQALCRDEAILAAFPNGVIWIKIGEKPTKAELINQMQEAARGIGGSDVGFDTLERSSNLLRNLMKDRAVLLVLDDVWDADPLYSFRPSDDARFSRLLFTTRNDEIAAVVGAQSQSLDVLDEQQSRRLLATYAGSEEADLPEEAFGILRVCHGLPLALAMIGALLHNKPLAHWKQVQDRLSSADLGKIGAQLPDYPYVSLLRVVLRVVETFSLTPREGKAIRAMSREHHVQGPNSRRIFLCHSSGDKNAVRQLYHHLLSDGFNPWLDEVDILPGHEWDAEIVNAVRTSVVVLICLSRGAVNKTGYIQKEIRYALDVAALQPEGAIFMIPVRLEECEVPERLRKWQWVNLFEEHGYSFLLRALAAKDLP